ncbi:pyrimidine dimer DNA glycosylase/endonuclease V [Shimazuella kribbensis]|uniref:pyrimidine dimer DNA glycosylase/endonuclease V n=1 Tax=Shimazuella kribbensis TaxID=139808 RepID=UPI0003F54C20|nr:pyrimidine dimer DNA glycosylase/endonuclease V [Shimazuella kribbensis]
MRIWSIHPKYLDTKGLVALWRETLLAQAVLLGNTKGYKNHPQLNRFKEHITPVSAIATYLSGIHQHAQNRRYKFDRSKIVANHTESRIPVTNGQVEYEKNWLLEKLKTRDQIHMKILEKEEKLDLHPLFYLIEGDIEPWEKI